MKTPAQILGKNENGLPQPYSTSKTPTGNHQQTGGQQGQPRGLSVETKAMVNMIFARFMAIYGHRFKSCFETQEEIVIAKREWALSIDAYTEQQLVKAVDRCKETLAWMPTISEFLSILEDLGAGDGVPAVRAAYLEACQQAHRPSQHAWSHPTVYHAGKETGWFMLKSEEEKDTWPLFRYHFNAVARRFRNGESLDIPSPKGITDNRDSTLFEFIQQWSQNQPVSEEQASSLLYYLTKPEGTRARKLYRQKAEEEVARLGLDITLPDTVSASF